MTWAVADLPERIQKRITVDPESGCWVVDGYREKKGYAEIRAAAHGIRSKKAHRVIWLLLVGPIPDDLVIDHREDWGCRDKACVWPAHLLPVTQRVNVTRPGSVSPTAVNAAKTHCDHGHEFDLLNTRWDGRGRSCRKCSAARDRASRQRLRAAA